MSIYAERNKAGKPTGTWVIEIRREGKIVRKRDKDLKRARQIEADLRAGVHVDTKPQRNSLFTLADLLDGSRSVYRGTKDERQSTQRLEASLGLLGLSVDIRTIRTQQLDGLVDTLRSRSLDNKTINRHLYAVSAAFKWALERDLIDRPLKVPRQPESVGRIAFLSLEDEPRFLEWLVSHKYEDVAFVSNVLIKTGFRITELLGLHHEAVTRDGWVHLYEGETKNDKGRAAYVGPELAKIIQYRLAYGCWPEYHRILKAMGEASEALGLDPAITPHVLRHTTATRLNSANVPTATIAKLLGHRTLVTTLKYAHVEDSALQDAAAHLGVPRKASPGAEGKREEANIVPLRNPLDYMEKPPEAEQVKWICSPLRNHSATRPKLK